MKLNLASTRGRSIHRRKRKRALTSPSSGSSSSSGSSEEDEDDDSSTGALVSVAVPSNQGRVDGTGTTSSPQTGEPTASSTGTTTTSTTHDNNSSSVNNPQPEGWRVKLYRLNADGSWDDCGTGRILCLYRTPGVQKPTSPVQDGHQANTNTSVASTLPSEATYSAETSTTTSTLTKAATSPASPTSNKVKTNVDQWLHTETGEATLCVHAEASKQNSSRRVLLRTRVLLRDAYQRQGDNIITWCEPYYGNRATSPDGNATSTSGNSNTSSTSGVDLALSFQDNAGCLDIWRQITQVQGQAAELLQETLAASSSVEDMAAHVAAQHHADLQARQAHSDAEMWNFSNTNNNNNNDEEVYALESSPAIPMPPLPTPPSLQNIASIADTIAALQHTQQRDSLAMRIATDDCAYLKSLLALFPAAETRGDYGKLAMLAACVKTILLLNDPSILEWIISVARVFEDICACLEYDPDLREKANHRWFLRDRAKFRTVVPMEDPELVSAIHRSFRVQYLRDTLLRPTMDESALSSLGSLQTFTHADVVKGVTMSSNGDVSLKDSYLIRVIRLLGVETDAVGRLEWSELEADPDAGGIETASLTTTPMLALAELPADEMVPDGSTVVGRHGLDGTATWKQYLAPQDSSLVSRKNRRRGCVSFLRELFNMVRTSLQQSDKDDFFAFICSLEIDVNDGIEIPDNVSQTSQQVEVGSVASTIKSERTDEKTESMVNTALSSHLEWSPPSSPANILSLLANILADPHIDVTEKCLVLEIVAGVAMHDPGLIRRHCLEYHTVWNNHEKAVPNVTIGRPDANERRQVLFLCPPNDLLGSLLFLLDVEPDAGLLLQVTEIMRIVLDTDMMGDHGPMSAFADEAEGIPPGVPSQPHQASGPIGTTSGTDQKQFLSIFFENYVEWLVAPFQFSILHVIRRVPDDVLRCQSESTLLQRIVRLFQQGVTSKNALLKIVPSCAIRSSFAVEMLSFCVRAHLYRMKFFLLKSRVLGNVLKVLSPSSIVRSHSGDRCLKLAALRFLRAVLSVNDEFYHRHIIQHKLFAPVFEAFRANPVGDNLVSSAIVEMCDYIHNENIKSLIEYIVSDYMSSAQTGDDVPSLEDVSSPYVSTLTVLRKAYETNIHAIRQSHNCEEGASSPGGSRYFPGGANHYPHGPRVLSGKALEDQRKFLEVDEEESYFESDDESACSTMILPATEAEVAQQQVESNLERIPRMYSLSPAPPLSEVEDAKEIRHAVYASDVAAESSELTEAG